MSLRLRLTLTVVGLLALGLAIAFGAVFGALQDWRAGAEEPEGLTHRVAAASATASAVALVAVGLLALRAVRLGLRPLERIATVAAAIGAGDLSRRVPLDDPRTEVGQLAQALNAMLGQVETAFAQRGESERRLRQFVADASHELRTPVAVIRGYAELFRRGAADRPEDLAKAMSRIEAEATRMGMLVDELLLLARLDQGRPLERAPVDLAALADEAVADALAVEPERRWTLAAERKLMVTGDAARLRQMLDNLLSNVRQHVPPGQPAMVRVRQEGAEALMEVADQGPGLTAAECARVFERFYRTESSRGRRSGGSGLGLAIVAAVAAAHGGSVSVRSAPGEGASFQVRLPLRQGGRPGADP